MALVIDDMIDTVREIQPIEHDVARINKIPDLYPKERTESKTPTFLLTYGGTHIGMMAQCGFDKPKSVMIEDRYHQLYAVSDEWVAEKLKEASRNGYVTLAFGLRLRTPLLKQVILGNNRTPWEASAEGRTAGNALGQSWCLLNSRALTEFMRKVRAHPVYRYTIKPVAQIHDANYLVFPDDIETLMWVNEHLVEAAEWQDHPDIQHPDVGLGGELSVFFPDWSNEIVIPNGASEDSILDLIAEKTANL